MKKLLIVLFISLFTLSGCTAKENTKTVCSAMVDNMQDTMILNATGDTVTLINEEIRMKWQDYDVTTEEEKEIFETMMLEAFASFKETEGVKLESKKEEESLLILIEIDTESANYNALKELGLITSENTEATDISLEHSTAQLSSAGYVCEIQE